MSYREVSLNRAFSHFLRQNGSVRHLGYTRVSARSQDAKLQVDALVESGLQERDIFADVTSGSRTAISRPGMKKLLDYAEPGDTVVVWRGDRLGRSLIDVLNTVKLLRERDVQVKSISDGIDPSTTSGRLMLNMLATLAEYERELITERVNAGIAAAPGGGHQVGSAPVRSGGGCRQAQARLRGQGKRPNRGGRGETRRVEPRHSLPASEGPRGSGEHHRVGDGWERTTGGGLFRCMSKTRSRSRSSLERPGSPPEHCNAGNISTAWAASQPSTLMTAPTRACAEPQGRRSRSSNDWHSLGHARASPPCTGSPLQMRELTHCRRRATRPCDRSCRHSIRLLSPWHLKARSRTGTSTSSSSGAERNTPTRPGSPITPNSISSSSVPAGNPIGPG